MEEETSDQEKWYALIKAAIDFNAEITAMAAMIISAGEQTERNHKKNVRDILKVFEVYADRCRCIVNFGDVE